MKAHKGHLIGILAVLLVGAPSTWSQPPYTVADGSAKTCGGDHKYFHRTGLTFTGRAFSTCRKSSAAASATSTTNLVQPSAGQAIAVGLNAKFSMILLAHNGS
jgi:hypothetical protein